MKYPSGKLRAFTDSLDDNGDPLPKKLVIGGKPVAYKPAISTQSRKQPNSEKPSETVFVTPESATRNNVVGMLTLLEDLSQRDPSLLRNPEFQRNLEEYRASVQSSSKT